MLGHGHKPASDLKINQVSVFDKLFELGSIFKKTDVKSVCHAFIFSAI